MIQKKVFDEISLNFPELFIIGKYVKIRFKNWGSPCYFVISRGQKIKSITKIDDRDCFCLRSWFHFFMTFLAQKLIYAINKQFWGRSSIKFNDRNGQLWLFQNRNPRWSPKSETLTVRKKSEKNMAVRSYFLKKT